MENFSGFDIFTLLLVAALAVRGAVRGFVTEILSLIAWVAAIFALRSFYEPVSTWAIKLTGSAAGGAVLAFVGLFLLTYISFRFIAKMLGKRTKESIVGPVDRVLGFGFGAVKALMIAALLFLLAGLMFNLIWGKAAERPRWMQAGRLSPLLELTSRVVVDFAREQQGQPNPDQGKGYSEESRAALDALIADKPPEKR